MFTAKIKDKSYQIEQNASGDFTLDGKQVSLDSIPSGSTGFHIIRNHKGYQVEVIELDKTAKTARIQVNGNVYDVELKDKFDTLLEQLGMSSMAAKKDNDYKAQMPGLIIDIRVQVGDEVKKGDPLLVLEAMKMENIIKSPSDQTIKSIKVEIGQAVEKKQLLIEFE
ncbi:MAG: biotin/lipoyl-containing protein [Flavobacteriales bacterium]